MQAPKVTIIIPYFEKNSHHWQRLCSAAEQVQEPFDLVIGCTPDASEEIIAYINDFRFSEEECCFINRVQIVEDGEALDRDPYLEKLRSKAETEYSFFLHPGSIFKDRESLCELAGKLEENKEDLQQLAESCFRSAGSASLFKSFRDMPVPDDVKGRVFAVRDAVFKRTRLSNIIGNLIWVIFFLMLAAFCRSFQGSRIQRMVLPAEILSYLFIILCLLRIAAKAAVTVFDKYIKMRRARRGQQ